MHPKIYKAKLISIHTAHHSQNQHDTQKIRQGMHAYFGMLQHIFQRNRHMIKELKLSGARIQNKNVQSNSVGCRSNHQSELFRSRNRLQKQREQQRVQLTKEKSVPRCSFPLNSFRNRSPKTRYTKQKNTKKEAQFMTEAQVLQFVPLGQASQRNLVLSNRSMPQNQEQEQTTPNQVGMKLNSTHNNSVNQLPNYKQPINAVKKQSLKLNRRFYKLKTQPSQVKTNYSSIRTTQNSNKQPMSSLNLLQVSAHQVTPW